MNDLIEKVKQGLKFHSSPYCDTKDETCHYLLNQYCGSKRKNCEKNLAVDALSVIEQLEAKVPKKGKWIFTGEKNCYGGTVIQCPFCEDKFAVSEPSLEIFCRTCGAQLREVESNG